MSREISQYQKEFIDYLVECEALKFGEFVTKSGRETPYFINTGTFNTGRRISLTGSFYARHMVNSKIAECDLVFGPAYKGIPLAVSTAEALYREFNLECGYCFDRKEEKDHGDKGALVGFGIKPGARLVIVEDVVTAGTTLKNIVPRLRDLHQARIMGVVVSVDRAERGSGSASALAELEETLGIGVYPIVNIHQVVGYLSQPNSSGLKLSESQLCAINSYLEKYGA